MKHKLDNNKDRTGKPQPWWKFWRLKKEDSGIDTRARLIDEFRTAHKNNLIEAEALGMLEGVMQINDLKAKDIMIPRSQITFIHRNGSYYDILNAVLAAGHSRYPVMDENRDDIDGILHAKDLLKYIGREDKFDIDDILRKPVYATESTRLDKLLTDFKTSRNHMAIVLDEYSGNSGLVTMEDVLEQIVGEIDDEHDVEDEKNIRQQKKNLFVVKAITPIDEFNSKFGTDISDDQFDTIGGVITHKIGKIPKEGVKVDFKGYKFHILSSDGRRIQSMEVKKKKHITPKKREKQKKTQEKTIA
jgi:magnesium and cobalt transporter